MSKYTPTSGGQLGAFVESRRAYPRETPSFESKATLRYLFLLCAFFAGISLAAQERFTQWHAEVLPRPDRTVEVTETLTAVSEGDEIKRGITRTLPVSPGHPVEVLSVTRDGATSPFRVEKQRGNRKIYVGERDVLLTPGTYTYTIRYRIENAVRPLDSLDELQFEVVGPDVSLPVEQASATLLLPEGLQFIQAACYTGPTGSRARNCVQTAPEAGQLRWAGTGKFGGGEQFSVAAGFAPGYFNPAAPVSGTAQEAYREPPPAWHGTASIWAVVCGTLLAFAYGYQTWRRHGVDPEKPRVGPVYTAPDDLSPAALAYLRSGIGTVGTPAFTASLLYLATRGYLSIDEEEDSGVFSTDYLYVLRATRPAPPLDDLSDEHRMLYDGLFAGGNEIRLEEKYDKKIRKLAERHSKTVAEVYGPLRDIEANGWKLLPLLGILILAGVPAVYFAHDDTTGYAMPAVLGYCVAGLMGAFLYIWLIRRPSPALVRLRTEIEALRSYLGLSEDKRKRLLNAPPMTRELYEDLLPYAIALGINTRWSQYFEDILTADHYRPAWLVGPTIFNPSRFDKSFTGVLQTSSTPPGTSSAASGGGGAVGGGVGGGGAGGW